MDTRLRRRKFGQLVIASMTASAIANLPHRVNAQKSAATLYGIKASNQDVASKDTANQTPNLVLVTSDTVTGKETSTVDVSGRQVENSDTKTENARKPIFTGSRERVTSLTPLSDGTLAAVSVASTGEGDFNRIAIIDPKTGNSRAVKVSGFSTRNSTLESLVATKENTLIGIASLNGGIPPFEAVGLELKGGKIVPGEKLALPILSPSRRYSNLTLTPNGVIYATSIGLEGSTALIKIDLNDKAAITGRAKVATIVDLKLEKEEVENDLLSLAISSNGEIFALADIKSKGSNSLYSINEKTGEMTFVRDFAVDKIAFTRG
jgi:hypothetical protein